MSYKYGDIIEEADEWIDACTNDPEKCALDALEALADEYLDDLIVLALEEGLPALYDALEEAGLPPEIAWAITAVVDVGATIATDYALQELGLDNALAGFREAVGYGGSDVSGFDYGPGTSAWVVSAPAPSASSSGVSVPPVQALETKNPIAERMQPLWAVVVPLFELVTWISRSVLESPNRDELRPHHRELANALLVWLQGRLDAVVPSGDGFGQLMGAWVLATRARAVKGPPAERYAGVSMLPAPGTWKIEQQLLSDRIALVDDAVDAYSNGPWGTWTLWELVGSVYGDAAANAVKALAETSPAAEDYQAADKAWSVPKFDVTASSEHEAVWQRAAARSKGRSGAARAAFFKSKPPATSGATWASARARVAKSIKERGIPKRPAPAPKPAGGTAVAAIGGAGLLALLLRAL